jgi:hypothetical protein
VFAWISREELKVADEAEDNCATIGVREISDSVK